jgi:hypothetical protein
MSSLPQLRHQLLKHYKRLMMRTTTMKTLRQWRKLCKRPHRPLTMCLLFKPWQTVEFFQRKLERGVAGTGRQLLK